MDETTASEIKTYVVEAMKNVLRYGKSIGSDGQTLTRADLPELVKLLSECNIALGVETGADPVVVELGDGE